MLLVFALVIAAQEHQFPDPSIRDLVVEAAEWKGEIQPHYEAKVAKGGEPARAFPRWLPGANKTTLTFHVTLEQPSVFVADFARANAPAKAVLKLDGGAIGEIDVSLASLKGEVVSTNDGPLGLVDQKLWTQIPSGEHVVTVTNDGAGWIEVPSVRFTGIGPDEFHIERTRSKTVRMREVMKMNAPQIKMLTWGVGVGSFPSDGGQVLKSLSISAVGEPGRVDKIRDLAGQEFNLLQVAGRPSNAQSLTVEVDATLELYRRRLVAGAAAEAAVISSEDRKRYLSFPDREGLPVLTSWVKGKGVERVSGEMDLDYAQRLLNVMQKHLSYKWDSAAPQGVGPCLKRGWGMCGDLNEVTVSALKLAGIPARLRPGRNVVGDAVAFGPAKDSDQHVAAEFWGEGIGWIPIEASAFLGTSLESGGPLRPILGLSEGNHVTKHYDNAWIDRQKRALQIMDFPFGRWEGSWEGWRTESSFGFQTVAGG